METIYLRDGTVVQAEVNGRDFDNTTGYALLVPQGKMSLRERLVKSVQIRVERDAQGHWREVPPLKEAQKTMSLYQALSISEFRKAQTLHRNTPITVEDVDEGYVVSYGRDQRHFVTLDALVIWLSDDVVNAQWTPAQEREGENHER